MATTLSSPFLARPFTTLLRGVCMLGIIVSHALSEYVELLVRYRLTMALDAGYFATGIFFCLSGYGITRSMQQHGVNGAFVWRHIRKLLLAYGVFWLFYVLLAVIFGRELPLVEWVWRFLTLRFPLADAWFFRTIVLLYLCYFALMRLTSKPTLWLSGLLVAYVAVLVVCGVSTWWWNTVLCFALGAIIAHRPIPSKPWPWYYLLVLAVLWGMCYKVFPIVEVSKVVAPLLLCVLVVGVSQRWVGRKLPVLSFMGTHSIYCYFMAAIPEDFIAARHLSAVLYVGSVLAITLALSYLAHKLVERGLRLIGKPK